MDDASFSRRSFNGSASSEDDIPEALRETIAITPRRRIQWKFFLWALLGLAIALISGALFSLQAFSQAASTPSLTAQSGIKAALVQFGLTQSSSNSLLGHLPYAEAPANTLQAITADGTVKLRRVAAIKFQEMVAAARANGVQLVPLSGFRSVTDQEFVFFDLKAQEGERPSQRAEVSAPPGYSEHHTGYAVDILDATQPRTDLEVSFENTPAFRWLQRNAARYNFEMSFPKNNPQGVSYEPWHWRFVGDRDSLETFYKARNFAETTAP